MELTKSSGLIRPPGGWEGEHQGKPLFLSHPFCGTSSVSLLLFELAQLLVLLWVWGHPFLNPAAHSVGPSEWKRLE